MNYEGSIPRSQLRSHLNQNYRLSIQNLNIEPNGDPKMAKKPVLQKMAEF